MELGKLKLTQLKIFSNKKNVEITKGFIEKLNIKILNKLIKQGSFQTKILCLLVDLKK